MTARLGNLWWEVQSLISNSILLSLSWLVSRLIDFLMLDYCLVEQVGNLFWKFHPRLVWLSSICLLKCTILFPKVFWNTALPLHRLFEFRMSFFCPTKSIVFGKRIETQGLKRLSLTTPWKQKASVPSNARSLKFDSLPLMLFFGVPPFCSLSTAYISLVHARSLNPFKLQ